MDATLLTTLTCPYCRAGLDVIDRSPSEGPTIDRGVVRCACYSYPIVDGILVLRQTSPPFDAIDPATVAVEAADVDGARRYLFSAASMVDVPRSRTRRNGSSARWRSGGRIPSSPPVHDDLVRLRPRGYAEYLYYRYANPSFVAALPLMAVLDGLRPSADRTVPSVLDLACGVGHSTAMLRSLFPSSRYVAVDPDFVNLYLLRRHFVPNAVCICLDADLPLPFADDEFDAVFCLDAFHYIRSKWALAHELDRVVATGGVWLLPHLHNAAMTNVSPGIPLPADDYLRLFDFLDVALLDESRVLDGFFDRQPLELTPSIGREIARTSPVVSMIGSRRPEVWRTYDIGTRLGAHESAHPPGPNPIYRITFRDECVRLDLRWPNAAMARECATIERYLPQHVELDRPLVERLRGGELSAGDWSSIVDLIRAFVLVPLAPGYRSPAGATSLVW